MPKKLTHNGVDELDSSGRQREGHDLVVKEVVDNIFDQDHSTRKGEEFILTTSKTIL